MNQVDPVIVGRARIAFMLGRSERTVSRWVRQGLLPAVKAGPFDNSTLTVRKADLEKLVASTTITTEPSQ